MPNYDEILSGLQSISGTLADISALMKKQQAQYEEDHLILRRIESSAENMEGALHKPKHGLSYRNTTVQARSS
jgi:hypothetical protein